MPEFHTAEQPRPASEDMAGELQFPPVSRDHILYCSYDYWFPKWVDGWGPSTMAERCDDLDC